MRRQVRSALAHVCNPPEQQEAPLCSPTSANGERVVWAATLRWVRSWLYPCTQPQRYWTRWSSAAPPPELAALLAHVASSLPLEAVAALT